MMGRGLAVAAFPIAGLAFALLLMGQSRSLWPAERVRVSGLATATDLQDAIDKGEIGGGGGVFNFEKTIEMPVSSESWDGVAYAFEDVTLTKLYCQTDAGTVVLDLQVDDTSPASIHGSVVTCDANGELIQALNGSTDFDATWTLDLVLGAVASSPEYVSLHLRGDFD